MSIVRVGLAETKNFAEGHRAIFAKKKATKGTKTIAKAGTAKKKKASRKKK